MQELGLLLVLVAVAILTYSSLVYFAEKEGMDDQVGRGSKEVGRWEGGRQEVEKVGIGKRRWKVEVGEGGKGQEGCGEGRNMQK